MQCHTRYLVSFTMTTPGQSCRQSCPGSVGRVGDGMEAQAQRQTQEKTAPLINILPSAVINYRNSLLVQPRNHFVIVCLVSSMD